MNKNLIVIVAVAIVLSRIGARASMAADAQFVIPIDGSVMHGRIEAGAVYTVTLKSVSGVTKGVWSGTSNANGEFVLRMRDRTDIDSPIYIEETDVLSIDESAGDPRVFVVPRLSARSNSDTEMIAGMTTPGVQLVVRAKSGDQSIEKDIVSDPAGEFSASFSLDGIDIEPGVSGVVEMTTGNGAVFVRGWAPIAIEAHIGEDFMSGLGGSGSLTEVRVETSTGQLLGYAAATNGGEVGGYRGWSVKIRNSLGEALIIAPGDVVLVQCGSEEVIATVPSIEGRILVDTNEVVGSVSPFASVTLEGYDGRQRGNAVSVTADDIGLFRHRFEDIEIPYYGAVFAKMGFGRHQVHRHIKAPGLTLYWEAGIVTGVDRPASHVAVRVERRGRAESMGEEDTDDEGAFRVAMTANDGGPYQPLPGDVIMLERNDASRDKLAEMRVADIRTDIRVASGLIAIEADRSLLASVSVSRWFPTGLENASASKERSISAGDRWIVDFGRPIVFGADSTVVATFRDGDGNVTIRRHNELAVNAQHSGRNVCGVAQPNQLVNIRLFSASGELIAAEDVRADRSGLFQSALAQRGGPVHISSGEAMEVESDGRVARLNIGPMSVEGNLEDGHIYGTVARRDIVQVYAPFRGCLPPAQPGKLIWTITHADDAGKFSAELALRDAGPAEVVVHIISGEGQRYYMELSSLTSETELGGNIVAGRVTSGQKVKLDVLDTERRLLCRAQAVGDDFGDYRVRCGGSSTRITSGSVITLLAGGSLVEFVVPQLDFDYSTEQGVVGVVGSPGMSVEIRLMLKDGSARTVHLVSDERARFAFGRGDLPVRSGWSFADVDTVEVSLEPIEGHRVFVRSVRDSSGTELVLPFLLRQVR